MAAMAVMAVEVRNAVVAVVVAVLAWQVLRVLWTGVWEPLRLRRVMAKQGLKGPPFKFLIGHLFEAAEFAESFPRSLPLGNYANFAPTVMPQYALYCPKYGTPLSHCAGLDFPSRAMNFPNLMLSPIQGYWLMSCSIDLPIRITVAFLAHKRDQPVGPSSIVIIILLTFLLLCISE